MEIGERVTAATFSENNINIDNTADVVKSVEQIDSEFESSLFGRLLGVSSSSNKIISTQGSYNFVKIKPVTICTCREWNQEIFCKRKFEINPV